MTCPHCGSASAWRNGHRDGCQRWLCRTCGREYVERRPTSPLNRAEPKVLLAVAGEKQAERLVCVQSGTAKGGKMECAQIQNSGLLKAFPEGLKGKIVEFMVKRENQGYKATKGIIRTLKWLVKSGANLYDPENVAAIIKKMDVKDITKGLYCDRYEAFLKFLGGTWEKPKYKKDPKIPYIPTESLLDQLISGLRGRATSFCQVAKETGASKSEILWLRWKDIDFERRQIAINITTKGHAPRVVSVSQKCIDMINLLPRRGERVFERFCVNTSFYFQRRRIAYQLGTPQLLKIGLHTFRHWKGTMEYHKTHDIIHVQKLLGHKDIRNTMVYIQYEQMAYEVIDDQFHVAVAHNVEETCKLVEQGFDYVTEYGENKVFRKRK